MEVVLLEFGLMGLNLIVAKRLQKDRNPWFSYFVAGMCFSLGITKLIELYVK